VITTGTAVAANAPQVFIFSPNGSLTMKSSVLSDSEFITQKQSFWKRILIIDDKADTTLTFKGIESYNYGNASNKRIQVVTFNDPLMALSEFKPSFFDLILVDINLPGMNGFELCKKILELDINVRACFMSSGEVNREALREIHPAVNLGCFIKKPIAIKHSIERIGAELD
jgi:CheY-like chemotaxis protein